MSDAKHVRSMGYTGRTYRDCRRGKVRSAFALLLLLAGLLAYVIFAASLFWGAGQ